MKLRNVATMSFTLLIIITLSVIGLNVVSAAEVQLKQSKNSVTNVKKKPQGMLEVKQQKQSGIVEASHMSHGSMTVDGDMESVHGEDLPAATVDAGVLKNAAPKKATATVKRSTNQKGVVLAVEQVERTEPEAGPEKVPAPERLIKPVLVIMPTVEMLAKPKMKDDGVSELWQLFSAGDFKALNLLIAEKKKEPGWLPPEGLMDLIILVKADKELLKAKKSGDYKTAIAMYKKSPRSFGCDRLGWVMFLAEGQMRSGDKRNSLATYKRALRQCNEDDRFSILEQAQGVLPLQKWQPLVKTEHRKHYTGKNRERMNKLWYKVVLQDLQIASDSRIARKIVSIADQLQPLVLGYKDASAAEILAWSYFQAEQFEKSLKNFSYAYELTESPDALRGKAFCLARLGHFAALDTLVEEKRDFLSKEGMLKDLLPSLAGYALTVKRYKHTIELLDELKSIRPLTMGEMSMESWSYYHFKQYDAAATSFEVLYRLKRDDDVGRGLYYSLLQAGNNSKMDDLSDELGGAFRTMVERLRLDDLYKRKQFMAVHKKNPLYSDRLTNLDTPYVRASYMAKFVQGAPIFSRMVLRKQMLEGRTVSSGIHEWNIRVERFSMDAGAGLIVEPLNPLLPADPGFNVGTMNITGLTNYATPNPVTHRKGYEWSIGYRYEDAGTTFAEIGQLLTTSGIKNDTKFRVGYTRAFEGRSFQIEGYRQPLRETMISYVGMLDPYQGVRSWGKVSRNGGKLTAYQALPYNLSLSGNVIGEVRKGHNVDDNSHQSAYLGLAYDVGLPKFEYFAVGPYARWEHSNMNQNHYTIGHGNYFSPQWLLDWGVSTFFMSEPGKRWLISGGASFGKQSIRETGSPYFPLTNNVGAVVLPNTYLASTNMEYHYQYDVALVVALADRWRFNAEYKQSRSWSIDKIRAAAGLRPVMDRSFMLSLTYHFDDRGTKLLRRDIPEYRLNPLY